MIRMTNASSRAQFLRFAGIGALGFVVDAGILSLLVTRYGFDPFLSRVPSFGAAVTVTWLANRYWVFERTQTAGREYAQYLTVRSSARRSIWRATRLSCFSCPA